MRVKIILSTFFTIASILKSQSQFINHNPFPKHYFIENKGQFEFLPTLNQAPLFVLSDSLADVAIFNNGFACGGDEHQISQIFQNTNPNPTIVSGHKTAHYYSFGLKKLNAFGYSTITIQNLYPNIDLQFEVSPKHAGFKYSFILKTGSNISDISWKIIGADSSTWTSPAKSTINSKYLIINQTDWKVYDESGMPVAIGFILENDVVKLHIQAYKVHEAYNIDPWVHTITNMDTSKFTKYPYYRNSGINADFDEAGNVYVYGGCGLENSGLSGKNNLFKIAKYNTDGTLKWIFQGKIDSLNWYSNSNWFGAGNFLVTPGKHKIYITQDFNELNGNKLIRLDSNGNYDNFIRQVKTKKLDFNYRNGFRIDKLLCNCIDDSYTAFGTDAWSSYGGYGSEELILKFSDTGIQSFSHPEKWQWPENQHQINNATQDPSGNRFILFGRNKTRTNTNNNSYIIETSLKKTNKGLDSSIWSHIFFDSFLAGYVNRIISGTIYTNWRDAAKYANVKNISLRSYPLWSMNATASDKNYVFVYEGKNLYGFHATTGKLIAIDSTICDTQRQQSGVAVDYSNHVFVGGDSSNIKVCFFNGKQFTRYPDIVLGNKKRRRIQDVKYDINSNTLIVTGDSLIAKISNPYQNIDSTLFFSTNGPNTCDNFLFVQLKTPDSASRYSFVWTDNKTQKIVKQVDSLHHFADTFFGPVPLQKYSVKIQRNFHCNGAKTQYQLSANPKHSTTTQLAFCMGDTWAHNSLSFYRDTTLTDSLKNQYGCDSVLYYALKFKPRSFTQLYPSICRGDSFQVGIKYYRNNGTFLDTFTNQRGCDSIVTTQLMVLPDTIISIQVQICLGDTIRFASKPFFSPGNYKVVTTRTNGCDSTINIQLIVNPPKFLAQQLSLCNTDSLPYRGKNYPLPFVLYDTLRSSAGCDSVFQLTADNHNIRSDFSVDSTAFPLMQFSGKTTNAKQWFWDFGDMNSSNLRSPSHAYTKSFQWANYKVCLVVRDSFGCDDTLCLTLPVKPAQNIEIPEGISPNGDGINDSLIIPGLWAFPNARWTIFNRWGQVVFTSNAAQNIAWDGKASFSGPFASSNSNNNNTLLPEGIYFIVFEYSDALHKNISANIYLKR